jgi:hypothetical protein
MSSDSQVEAELAALKAKTQPASIEPGSDAPAQVQEQQESQKEPQKEQGQS